MKKTLLLLFTLIAGISQAQDILKANFYSVDRIMEMREQLKLTDNQATNIKKIHAENAGQFSELKRDLDQETRKLRDLLEGEKINQSAVSRQLDAVLNLENQLKRHQLNTLVAIKNQLTEEQKEILNKPTMIRIKGSASTEPVTIVDGVPLASSVSGTAGSSPKVAVSVNGNGEQPLYFIETKTGLKKVNSFSNINPKDINSMSVLKGEEALKKYGVEGKNGVVIITLKQTPEN
ncbi:Spy/CpxP family protein refolding chaperone [Algoriphagus sp. CAU 1675]|uniref:Spy/CpxP family protein refolding chaperone n=1 Tax=Algoriphagus sp. CAU 1675 TaxID=3032597 RepID=UPI0023DCE778|nr:Spy/CpxP family protein refolding chaperone [Algoriphagus sp. CAU 1675]MDF2158856.1 Spy/CpxP family protein refolding chaperone [Algoriphagus sp. CAU 1675]